MGMKGVLHVRQDKSSGNWFIYDEDKVISQPYARRQDARAQARALLLERGSGSMVVEAPSGRIQEKLSVSKTNDRAVVHAA